MTNHNTQQNKAPTAGDRDLAYCPFRNLLFWHAREVRKAHPKVSKKKEREFLEERISDYHLSPVKEVLLFRLSSLPTTLPARLKAPDEITWSILRYNYLRKTISMRIVMGDSNETIRKHCEKYFPRSGITDQSVQRFREFCFTIPHPIRGNHRDILATADSLQQLGKIDEEFADYARYLRREPLSLDMCYLLVEQGAPERVLQLLRRVLNVLAVKLASEVKYSNPKNIQVQLKNFALIYGLLSENPNAPSLTDEFYAVFSMRNDESSSS